MFSANWQPWVPKYNWVNWQWAGFTNTDIPGRTHIFKGRITDCSIVFQIHKYVNLTCFLNVCKHIMVFLCFSRVKILHTAPLRVTSALILLLGLETPAKASIFLIQNQMKIFQPGQSFVFVHQGWNWSVSSYSCIWGHKCTTDTHHSVKRATSASWTMFCFLTVFLSSPHLFVSPAHTS